jgi:hypothetical protein
MAIVGSLAVHPVDSSVSEEGYEILAGGGSV